MDPVHLISYLSSLSADLQQWLTAPHPLPRRTGVRQRRPQVPGRLAARREPPAARRLAAPDRLAAGLSAPQSPLASPVLCSRLQCLPACRCGAADCRRPRAPAARPVPGRSPAWSRLARARCAAAGCRAPDARYGWMDSGSLDWDRVETLSCLFVQLGLAALGFRV